MRQRNYGVLLLITSFTALGFTGCTDTKTEKNGITNETSVEETVAVKVASVDTSHISDVILLSGVISAKNEVVITSKISGELKSLTKDIGLKVTKGETLATLDSTAYNLQNKKAILALENTKASLKNVENQLARTLSLVESGAVTEVEVEQVKLQTQMAEIAAKNAQLDLESTQLNLGYCKIISPISGVVTEKNGAIGENLGAGQMLYRIVDTSHLVVETGVSENQVSRVKTGTEVKLTIGGEEPISGKVENVSSVMDLASKTYPVRISVNNGKQALKVGMTVSIEVALGDDRDTLAIEKGSVIISNDTYSVMKVVDGKAVKTQITIGASSATHYEILSGLKIGDSIITSNPGLLKGNETVKIVE